MKAQIINTDGKKSGEISLPEVFESEIREDVIGKVVEAEKRKQPYAPFWMAGKQASASGNLRRSRRKWKNSYGYGISRVPRKIISRHGTRFNWIGAEINSTRKGREAHPPRVLSMLNFSKINKKEYELALNSSIAASANLDYVKNKYSSLAQNLELPLVISNKVLEMKAKDFVKMIKQILPLNLALKNKEQRAGKGKIRGRRTKSNSGAILIISDNEKTKIGLVDVRKISELSVSDLASGKPGRLVLWSEEAIKQLKEKK